MNSPAPDIAVVIPVRSGRHRLGPSLASVAAQTHAPAQILILDQESADGLGDWLLIRWPGVDLLPVPPGMDLEDALQAVAAPAIAFLEAGDRWPCDHLATLAQAWIEDPDDDLLAAPVIHLARAGDGSLRRQGASDAGLVPLSAIGVRTAVLLDPTPGPGTAILAEEIQRRCSSLARPASLSSLSAVKVIEAAAEIESWADGLADAVASLPGSGEVVLIGLQAAHHPLASLEQLGLAVQLGRAGRSARAFTLGDLTWAALEAAAPTSPLLLCSSAALDLAHASDLICLEEILRRSGGRPVRICARSLSPSTPVLLGRLLETVAAHPDVELWLGDAASRHYAASLLGPARARLMPPPLLALAPLLRELAERALIEPAMLGIRRTQNPDLARCMADPILWWQGVDPSAGSRLAQGLARVLGTWRWLKGPVLQRAWLTALVGWARMHGQTQPVRTSDLDHALLAALCGCPVLLESGDAKTRDLAATWPQGLRDLGIAVDNP